MALKYITEQSAKLVDSDIVLCFIDGEKIIANGIFRNIIIKENDLLELRRNFKYNNDYKAYEKNHNYKELLLKEEHYTAKTIIHKIVYINSTGDYKEHSIDKFHGKQNILSFLLFTDLLYNYKFYESEIWNYLEYSYTNYNGGERYGKI